MEQYVNTAVVVGINMEISIPLASTCSLSDFSNVAVVILAMIIFQGIYLLPAF